MKELIQEVKGSIWSPLYYSEIPNRSLYISWLYFTKLAILSALVMTVALGVVFVPIVSKALNEGPVAVMSVYPDELSVHIQKGKVTTNVIEPYFIQIPDVFQNGNSSFKHLIVIDTATPFSVEQFNEYGAYAWVTADSIVSMKDQSGRLEFQSFDKVDNFILTEQILSGWIEKIRPIFKFVIPGMIMFLFVGLCLRMGFALLTIAFIAIFVLLLGVVMKRTWSYSLAYRYALHAYTLPFLLSVLFMWLSGGSSFVISAVLTLFIVFCNTKEEKKEVIVEQ